MPDERNTPGGHDDDVGPQSSGSPVIGDEVERGRVDGEPPPVIVGGRPTPPLAGQPGPSPYASTRPRSSVVRRRPPPPWPIWAAFGFLLLVIIVQFAIIVSDDDNGGGSSGILPEVTTTQPSVTTTSEPATTTSTPAVELVTAPITEAIQLELAEIGYYTGVVDGSYSADTVEAVRSFQADASLEPDGKYGPTTHDALVSARDGAESDIVVALQTELADRGFYEGAIDADWGPATTAALEAAQAELGVTEDGLISAETLVAWEARYGEGA